jgi:type I site-specific restriction endonuclease
LFIYSWTTATIDNVTLGNPRTRKEIIDICLSKAGWNVNDPSQVTEELDIVNDPPKAADRAEKYTGHLFSDYALLGRDGYPMAVVEARLKAFVNANNVTTCYFDEFYNNTLVTEYSNCEFQIDNGFFVVYIYDD